MDAVLELLFRIFGRFILGFILDAIGDLFDWFIVEHPVLTWIIFACVAVALYLHFR